MYFFTVHQEVYIKYIHGKVRGFMGYQYIYILIGLLAIIANIVLFIIYLKINFFFLSKKVEPGIPKQSAIEENEQNIMEPFENTIDVDESQVD